MAQAPGEPLVAYYSRAKLIGWLILSAIMPGMALYLFLGPFAPGAISTGSAALLYPWLALSVIFFGGVCVMMTFKLFDRREQVRIDEQGLMVRAHTSKAIPMRSLTGIAAKNGLVSIGVLKIERFPIESWHRRLIRKANGKQGGAYFGDLWISISQLDCSPQDIFNAVHDFRKPTEFELEMREKGAPARSDIVPHRLS